MTPVSKYWHECEPVGLMMITGIMMQHKVLCLLDLYNLRTKLQ